MGLLDQFTSLSPEQNQGLLAAAAQMLQQSGPSRTPTSFGQTLGGGLTAYQGAMEAAKRRKQEEEQAQQMAQMRAMQIQQTQQEMQRQQAQQAQQDQMRDAARESVTPGGFTFPTMLGMPEQGPSQFDQQGYIDRMMKIDPIAALKAKAQFAPKAKELKETTTEDVDGKRVRVNWYKDGSHEIVQGVSPRKEMKVWSGGGRDVVYDPDALVAGQEFKRTQTPGEASSAGIQRERLNFDKQQPRGQIIQTDQGPMLADPRAATAQPITGPSGQALGPKVRPVPTQIQKAYVENNASLRKVKAALDAVTAYPGGLGMTNYLGDTIRQRTDPEGVKVRALVADIGSQKIHDRSGAAVTAAETPRLKPFIPSATDDPETIKKKLGMFQLEYQAMQREMEELYSSEMGYRPLGKSGGDQADPAAPPRDAVNMLKMNPKLRAQFDEKYGAGAAASVLGQ